MKKLIDFITYGCCLFYHLWLLFIYDISFQPMNPISSQLHSYPSKLHIFDPPTNLEEPDCIIFRIIWRQEK